MRKIVITFFALLFIVNANAQFKTFYKNIYAKFGNYENVDGKLETEVDSVFFSFKPNTENFWELRIENGTNSKIYVDWENANIVVGKEVSPIVFSTDTKLTMNQPKKPELVLPGTYVKREIDQKTNYEDSYTGRLFTKKYIKGGYEWHVKITIPIEKNEVSKEYLFDIIIYNTKK